MDARARSAASRPPGGRPQLVLIASIIGFTLVIVGTTVVNVALPTIHHDLGTSIAGLQWVINLYTLMLAGLLLTMGSLCDRLSARTMMLFGAGVFAGGALVAAVAPNLVVLLVGQALLGTGASAMLPASLALISHAYSDNQRRARAISVYASASAVAIGVGPVLGGLLIDSLGWRAIFVADIPFAAATAALVLFAVPRAGRHTLGQLDLLGQVAGVVCLGALTFAVINSGSHGWTAPTTWLALLVAAGAGAGFVVQESAASAPMLSLAIFRSRAFDASALAGLLVNFAVYGQFFVLSLYLQNLRGQSPTGTGLLFLAQPTVAAVTALIGGWITTRRGARIPTVLGGLIAAAGTATMALLGLHSSYGLVVLGLALLGAGGGLAVPALTVAVVSAAARREVGVATATFTASRQLGSILGVAVLGGAVGQPLTPTGLHAAVWIATASLVVAAGLGTALSRSAAGATREELAMVDTRVSLGR